MGKPNSECSIEELQAKAKMFRSLLIVFCVMLFIVAATYVYFLVNGNRISPAMIAALVAILGGSVPSMSGLVAVKKEIEKKEIESRNENES